MYQEISYEIVIFYHIFFWGGGGLVYEHLWQETFAAGAVFRSSALCLLLLESNSSWPLRLPTSSNFFFQQTNFYEIFVSFEEIDEKYLTMLRHLWGIWRH